MIDLHHHCLPDVDDGPRGSEEAVAMCRMAVEEGIEIVVATPHLLRGRWPARAPSELEERLASVRDRVGDSPRLLLGAECFFSHDLETRLAAGEALPLAGSRYVLIEFASDTVPPNAERVLHQMQLARWIPVIAHPERNAAFGSHPELLAALVGFGALTQVTAGSLTGQFGRNAQRSAERWIAAGLVHFVSTDAHNVRNRPPVLRRAAERLRKLEGDAVAQALTLDNPLAVVESRPLPFVPPPEMRSARGLLARFRSLFGDT